MKTTSKNQTRVGHRSSAFTLVELLVVMGIIALLMGILLPSLSASREEANMVLCTTHLDQVFKASYMFATENDDRLPHFGWPSGRNPDQEWWPTQILNTLNGETAMYLCPSDDNPHQNIQVVRKPGGSLAMSAGTEPGRFPLDITYRGSCDSVTDAKRDGYYYGRRITDWDNPSHAMILVEATVKESGAGDRECFRFGSDLMIVGTDEWYATNLYVKTWERHSGSSNLLFLDGGIGRHKPREIPGLAERQEFWDSTAAKKGETSGPPKRKPAT